MQKTADKIMNTLMHVSLPVSCASLEVLLSQQVLAHQSAKPFPHLHPRNTRYAMLAK
jgi:hypothetical protein